MYALDEKMSLIEYNRSDIYLFAPVKRASPLPQAAHIGISRVQRVAQTNEEAKNEQDGGALQRPHGPEGKEYRHLQRDAKTQTFQQGWHRSSTIKQHLYNANLVLQQICKPLMLLLGHPEEVMF